MSEQVIETTAGPRTVFVIDIRASLPTWALTSTLWHYFYSSGLPACGAVFSSTRPTVAQHFYPHTKRRMFPRTITTLCKRCLRRAPSTGNERK